MITEKLMALGSWTINLDPDRTPPNVLGNPLKHFGHIAILPQRVDPNLFSDPQLKAMARYSGILRQMDWQDNRKTISGPGLLAWLGDENGRGYIYQRQRSYQFQGFENSLWRTTGISTFSNEFREFRPDPPGILQQDGISGQGFGYAYPVGLNKGTVDTNVENATYPLTGLPVTFDANLFAITPRVALSQVMDNWEAEFRVNPDGTLDAGYEAFLFNTSPTSLIVRKNWGDDPNYNGVSAKSMRVNTDTKDFASLVFATASYAGTSVTTGKASGFPGSYGPIETIDFIGNLYHRSALVNEPTLANDGAANQLALKWYNELSVIKGATTISATDFNIEGEFEVGDTVMVYDPETEHFDLTQEIPYRGQILHPKNTRVTGMTWPVTDQMGVYYRSSAGIWTDITDWVIPDTGNTTIEVGYTNNKLLRPKPFDSGSVIATDRSSVPSAVTNLTATTGSYEIDDDSDLYTAAAWIQLQWDGVGTNDTGTAITDLARYDVRWRPGVHDLLSPLDTTGTGFGEGFGTDAGFTPISTFIQEPWEVSTVGADVQDSHMVGDGTGDRASTPDSAALDITGNMTIIASVTATDWTPAGDRIIVRKGDTSNYGLQLAATGTIEFRTATTNYATVATIAATDDTRLWIKAVYIAAAGTVDVSTSTDGTSYTLLEQITGVPTSLTANATLLTIGSDEAVSGTEWLGDVFSLEIIDSITTVFNADFTTLAPAVTSSFTEYSTNAALVTLAGDAVIGRDETFVIDGLPIDTYYELEVRAVDDDSNASPWVAVDIRSASDTFAPATPTPPILTTVPLLVIVTHRLGTAAGGGFYSLDIDLNHLNVYASSTSGFTANNLSFVTSIPATVAQINARSPVSGSFPTAKYGTGTIYVRVTAVDHHGNESAASTEVSTNPVFVDIDDIVPNLLNIDVVQVLPTFDETHTPPLNKWYYLAVNDTTSPGAPPGGFPGDTIWSWNGTAWVEQSIPDSKVIASKVYAGAMSIGAIKAQHLAARSVVADSLAGGSLYLGPLGSLSPGGDGLPKDTPAFVLGGTMVTTFGGLVITAGAPAYTDENGDDHPAEAGTVQITNLTATHITSGEFILQIPVNLGGPGGGATAIRTSNFNEANGAGFYLDGLTGTGYFNKLKAKGQVLTEVTALGQLNDGDHGINIDTLNPTSNYWVHNPVANNHVVFRAGNKEVNSSPLARFLQYDSDTGVSMKGTINILSGSTIDGALNVQDVIYMPNVSAVNRIEMVGGLAVGTEPSFVLRSNLDSPSSTASLKGLASNNGTDFKVFHLRPAFGTGGPYTDFTFTNGPALFNSWEQADSLSGLAFVAGGRFSLPGALSWPYGQAAVQFLTFGGSDTPVLFSHNAPVGLDGTQIVIEAGAFANIKDNAGDHSTDQWFSKFLVRGELGVIRPTAEMLRFGINYDGYVFMADVPATPHTPATAGIHLFSLNGVLKYRQADGTIKTISTA